MPPPHPKLLRIAMPPPLEFRHDADDGVERVSLSCRAKFLHTGMQLYSVENWASAIRTSTVWQRKAKKVGGRADGSANE